MKLKLSSGRNSSFDENFRIKWTKSHEVLGLDEISINSFKCMSVFTLVKFRTFIQVKSYCVSKRLSLNKTTPSNDFETQTVNWLITKKSKCLIGIVCTAIFFRSVQFWSAYISRKSKTLLNIVVQKFRLKCSLSSFLFFFLFLFAGICGICIHMIELCEQQTSFKIWKGYVHSFYGTHAHVFNCDNRRTISQFAAVRSLC